jgi:hypothetical protein
VGRAVETGLLWRWATVLGGLKSESARHHAAARFETFVVQRAAELLGEQCDDARSRHGF